MVQMAVNSRVSAAPNGAARPYPRFVAVADESVDGGWRFVSIGFEGQVTNVDGIDPWQVDWEQAGQSITVAHPQYPEQRHRMSVYTAAGTEPTVVFAAGEFSNGVWGFFVPA